MVFTRKLFPFFFPPPPPPFPSSDSSVVDVRGSSKPRRICKLFFLSLLNRFDKGGEKRGEEGGSDGCCGKEGLEGRNEANKYNRRGIRTKRGARSPMKEIYDCLLIKKGRGGDRIVSSRSRKD